MASALSIGTLILTGFLRICKLHAYSDSDSWSNFTAAFGALAVHESFNSPYTLSAAVLQSSTASGEHQEFGCTNYTTGQQIGTILL
jgi:hypothetical protein